MFSFKMMLWFNGVHAGERVLDRPKVFRDVQILAADGFRPRVPGFIKNMNISTGETLFFNEVNSLI